MTRALSSTLFGIVLIALATPCLGAADMPLAQALSALGQRLEETPRDAGLLADYGNLLTRAGRFEEARTSYRAALELDSESLITLYDLGLLEFELGHGRRAGRHFRHALKIDRDFARGHYGLGTVLTQRGLHRRAVKHFSKAFSLEPELLDADHNPEILFNRLATWASINSYLIGSPQRGTRLYNDPQPIVGLLLPDLELLEPVSDPGSDSGLDSGQPSDEPVIDEGDG